MDKQTTLKFWKIDKKFQESEFYEMKITTSRPGPLWTTENGFFFQNKNYMNIFEPRDT